MKAVALSFVVAVVLLFAVPAARTQRTAGASLKDVFKSDFLIGAALNRRQFFEEDQRALPIIKSQFNSITPENQLKWQLIHPQPDKYDWEGGDRYVAFGEKYGMTVIGHTLVWHRQTPPWVFDDGKGNRVDRETLLARLHDHIQTVVGRYKGRIKGWDVVNEALNADGTMRQSNWMKIIGEDYVAKAFQFAHEADPQAELYYNDYSLENEPKRNGAIQLIQKLKSQGVPVAAVGLQGHNNMKFPSLEQQDATIEAFAKLGIKVNITELDIDVLPHVDEDKGPTTKLTDQLNPFTSGLPQSLQDDQAKRFADLFSVYLKHRDVIDRITFWGVTDGDTWLNNWPVRGRTNYPLLFDREGKAKPAFDAVMNIARSAKRQ
ncbi:MAG TPA: endo-1,4-beta-xylanase [Pyrinomonadaceae bacterium]|jgi:Beta-1,4-xylanase|nr:endo-1,4-beta-xylanase [Pyrinomonadaceae bacterium]